MRRLRRWLAPPRRLLLSFVLLLLLPATAVVWLGLRLMQQDRDLESRQLLERRGVAADRASAALDQAVSATERSPTLSMSAVIASGGHLTSDGAGAYVDGVSGSVVRITGSASLSTTDSGTVTRKSRYAGFNLNAPVAGDPFAVPLGVVLDPRAHVKATYYLEPADTDGQRQIHSVQELPDDGVFHVSERSELHFRINGTWHLLMFGGENFRLNVCHPESGLIFAASGTTMVQMARLGDTYVVQAPPGSVARLFDCSNPFNPIDRGLYEFSFVITFAPKATKGRGK